MNILDKLEELLRHPNAFIRRSSLLVSFLPLLIAASAVLWWEAMPELWHTGKASFIAAWNGENH